MPRALLSVSDKTGLTDLAKQLADRGFELVSTGGTASALSAAGLPVVPVSDVTHFPEMLGGRVKTLHPAIHGGILARRSRPADLEAIDAHGIRPIDLVVVNLYPFERAAADASTPFDDLMEEIDIGGPSLVRAAAKNFRDVLIVVAPSDYPQVVNELDRDGGVSAEFRLRLAQRAFAHTAAYDAAIAVELDKVAVESGAFRRTGGDGLPRQVFLHLRKVRDLRYGENPHQPSAWYRAGAGDGGLRVTQGKELSFTNLLDVDSAGRIAVEFAEPAAVVIKHTNPCGAATGATLAEAYVRARDADALAAFGGIVGLNREIDTETASAIVSTFIEAVVAPGMSEDAAAILAAKKNMRVVIADVPALLTSGPLGRFDLRSMLDGILIQHRDRVVEAADPWPPGQRGQADDASAAGFRVVTRRQPTEAEWQALRFAWRVCAHVKSNAVIFTGRDRTLAVGAGQTSRVDAVKVAMMKAAERAGGGAAASAPLLAGSVAASDAFFPFRDGLDAVAAAGATAVVQPGGSVRDAEVIAAADEHGLAMAFAGRRHFRH
jgi:phosphoribosylaminoimidazolecarboxamide formyltransferase / IMP cyclohydrolase